MFAGFDDGAHRSADRVGAVAARESHSLGGEAVDGRGGVHRFQPPVVGADGIGGMVVGENEDDVRALGGGGFGGVGSRAAAEGGDDDEGAGDRKAGGSHGSEGGFQWAVWRKGRAEGQKVFLAD